VSVARQYVTAGLAVARRDLAIFVSYRTVFVTQFLQAIFTLTLFYYVSRLLAVGQFGSPDEYYAFLVVGLVVLRVLIATAGQLPMTIRQELVAGTFERLLVSPFGPIGGVIGMMLFPFLNSLVLGTLMILFAALVFGLPLEGTAVLAIPTAVLATLALAPLALLLGAAVLAFKQAAGGATVVVALLSLVAGFYFPVTILPDWIEWTSEVQPLTPTLELMRHVVIGAPLTDPAWLSAVKLVGFAVVLSFLALFVVRAAIEWSQRKGTIIEY
jgi:ABC-2 type transport system permease protein